MENLTKVDINNEIKQLRASLNQTNDPARKAEIQSQIKILQGSRNTLIAGTHQHSITHVRLATAANIFDATHKPRVDID